MQNLEFTQENNSWICIYSGNSGAVQMAFDKTTQVEFLGDAGLGIFDSISSSEGGSLIYNTTHLLKYISMVGLSRIQIKCSNKPTQAIINTSV